MRMHLQLTILLICLLASCGLLSSSDSKQEEVEQYFTAEINGEPFDGMPSVLAAITKLGAYDWMNIFGYQFSEQMYPYNEKIAFALTYEQEVSRYDAAPVDVSIENGVDARTGGAYFEKDGDVRISMYEALSDGDGFITVEMEQLEDGRTVVSGTFQMTVAKKFRDSKLTRRKQDTLHITNGKYRLLLKDDREEE